VLTLGPAMRHESGAKQYRGGHLRPGAASVRIAAMTDPLASRRLGVAPSRLTPARIVLVAAAAIGSAILLVLAVYRWDELGDSHAYWLAGRALVEGRSPYELSIGPVVPFAYHYPPPLAQVMAPVSMVLDTWPFEYAWLGLMGACLAWIAGWRPLVALALAAIIPVAVEFWFRNIHLQLAVLSVLAIRYRPALFGVAAAVKLSPAVGIVYLAAAGRWRSAAEAALALAAIVAVSWLLAPELWVEFVDTLVARGPGDASGILPIPYVVRVGVAVVLAFVAGRIGGVRGEVLAFVAIGVGLPTLWMTGFSFFVGLVVWMPELLRQRAIGFRRPPDPRLRPSSPVQDPRRVGDGDPLDDLELLRERGLEPGRRVVGEDVPPGGEEPPGHRVLLRDELHDGRR